MSSINNYGKLQFLFCNKYAVFNVILFSGVCSKVG